MPISDEYEDAPVPDRRLAVRLGQIAELVAAEPAASFPQLARSDGELEGLYRFINNPRVTAAAILAPHLSATMQRVRGTGDVGIVHDTTEFDFAGSAGACLGWIPHKKKRGFFGHFALAVDSQGNALGLAGCQPLIFENFKRGTRKSRRPDHNLKKPEDRASARWGRMVEEVSGRLPDNRAAVHLMDREADAFPLLVKMSETSCRFVVRVRDLGRPASRELGDAWEPIGRLAELASFACERTVPLSKRKAPAPGMSYTHQPRKERNAKLHIAAMNVVVQRPKRLRDDSTPKSLALNVVRVFEVEVPHGEEGVEWLLFTNEPIDTRENVERVVDWYRRRWTIEEFFKALKTGCAFEKRQFESRAGVLKTLALLSPIAWQLLTIRDLAQRDESANAEAVLSKRQVRVLRGISKRPLPQRLTLREALLSVAAQGGHLRRNGPPGWQTLGRGLEKLWWAELGYALGVADGAKARQRKQ